LRKVGVVGSNSAAASSIERHGDADAVVGEARQQRVEAPEMIHRQKQDRPPARTHGHELFQDLLTIVQNSLGAASRARREDDQSGVTGCLEAFNQCVLRRRASELDGGTRGRHVGPETHKQMSARNCQKVMHVRQRAFGERHGRGAKLHECECQ
jgi:hypothetical protein